MHTFRFIIMLSVFIALSACKNCVECTGCDVCATCPAGEQDMNVSEICYSEAKDYYANRREWRDDIKAYEKLWNCECN